MRSFDLSPLYRSTVGFDRLAGMLDQLMAGDAPAPFGPRGQETAAMQTTLD